MPENNLQTLTINDFSPGVYSYSDGANTLVPAPFGAASPINTRDCIALPQGGLGPLPDSTTGENLPFTPPSPATDDGNYWVNGIKAYGTIVPNSSPNYSRPFIELHVGLTWRYNSPANTQKWLWRRYIVNTSTWQDLGSDLTSGGAPSPYTGVEPASFAFSRMGTYSINNPVIVGGSGAGGIVANSHLFPDPTSPGSATSSTMPGVSSLMFSHQSRIFGLDVATSASTPHGTTTSTVSPEILSYTDPPLSALGFTANFALFTPEQPFGYGAWGSVSAGELFLVKCSGGGVSVSGDVFFPSVTRLAGVVPTGELAQEAVSSSIGLVYCSKSRGVFVWSGGNSSQKISQQLAPDFYVPVIASNRPVSAYGLNVLIQHTLWNDWIIFPNNYLYDTVTKSWWIHGDIASPYHMYSAYNHILFATKQLIPAASSSIGKMFNSNIPSPSYSWQSLSISPIPSRMVQIREIELVASASNSASIVHVYLTNETGTQVNTTFNIPGSGQPYKLRQTVSCEAYTIIIRITTSSTSSAAAPIIHSLTLNYRESTYTTST